MTDASSTTGTASSNRSVMIVLSYLWLLALIPLLVEKGDSEVQWHAKHGIVLVVAEIIVWIALAIVNTILASIFFALGCAGGLLGMVIWLGIIVLHVMCIVKGLNGQRLMVPGISEYANRF